MAASRRLPLLTHIIARLIIGFSFTTHADALERKLLNNGNKGNPRMRVSFFNSLIKLKPLH